MKKNRARLLLWPVLLALAAAGLTGCKDFSFYGVLGDRINENPLQIAPTEADVPVNGTLAFSATGGTPEYSFEVLAPGTGTIDADGLYTAPPAGGVAETIRVTDGKGQHADATVNVTTSAGPLAILPASISVSPGYSLTFIAAGGIGSPPVYTFSWVSNLSGGSLTTSGIYQAGSNPGVVDIIQVSDGVSAPPLPTAAITVTAVATNVEYELGSSTLPSSGTGGDEFAYSLTIQNTGSADGTKTVSWWLYLSDDGSLGSGDTLLAGGTAGALAASAYTDPPITGNATWPRTSGTKTLFVMIAADDDLSVYTSGGFGVTLAPPDVDYVLSGLAPDLGYTIAGGTLRGTFDLANTGSSDGSLPVSWTVYVSTDNSWQDTDPVVDAGSTAKLNKSSSLSDIAFEGTWPAAAASYFLIVRAAAADEPSPADTSGNTLISPNPGVAVTEAPIDYEVTGLSVTGKTAGGAVSGSFTIGNPGSANGGQDVHWTAYASINATVEGTDTVVDAGVEAALNSSDTTVVSYQGLWPSVPGNYYLIVRVSASDEPAANTGNNTLDGGETYIDVPDYVVPAVDPPGGSTATAGAFTGSFTLRNQGTVAGTKDVSWVVYASLGDGILDPGTDAVVDSGTYTTPRLGPSPLAPQTSIPIGGVWPADEGNYWLIVKVAAADEQVATNNEGVTASYVPVNRPKVNYAVSNFTYTGPNPTGPATAVEGSFCYSNAAGADDGSQWVNWTVYASLDGTIDATDPAVAWGSVPSLDAGEISDPIPYSGFWPLSYGNYSLILQAGSSWEIEVDASDNRSVLAPTAVGIYQAIVQNCSCVTLSPFTDLTGVVLRPGMTVKVVSSDFPSSHLDHLFRLNTGTATNLTVSWVLGPPVPPVGEELGIFLYDAGPPVTYTGYALTSKITELSMSFPILVADQNSWRWIDLFNPKTANIGPYVLYISAN